MWFAYSSATSCVNGQVVIAVGSCSACNYLREKYQSEALWDAEALGALRTWRALSTTTFQSRGNSVATKNIYLVSRRSTKSPNPLAPMAHRNIFSVFSLYTRPSYLLNNIHRHPNHLPKYFYFIFFRTHLLSSFWTSRGHRCRPFSSRVLAFIFRRAQGSAIPLLVDFSSSVANSRARALRKSMCAQEKIPTKLYECALGGIRTHQTDIYHARG